MRVIYDPAADALYIEVLPLTSDAPRSRSRPDAPIGDAFVGLTYGDAVAGVELREVSRDLPRGRVPTADEVVALVRRRGVPGIALIDLHVVVKRALGDRAEPEGGDDSSAARP